MTARQRAEATGKPASPGANMAVMWRGKRFALPRPQEFPLEALEAEEDGKHLTALKLILGLDQYATWRGLASTAADAEDFSTKGHEGAGPGKPVTAAALLADEATAEAVETDLLRYGVDLLDLYRGGLSFRRVCALVTHLPDDAAVWRVLDPRGGWSRADLLASVTERRIAALWATVASAVGQEVTDAQLADPMDAFSAPATPTTTRQPDAPAAELKSLREIAVWMRSG